MTVFGEPENFYRQTLELRQKIEIIGRSVRELECGLSAHDSIMAAAGGGIYELSEINEAIYYAKDALLRLGRISEAMEIIGGEVSRLRWEIDREKRQRTGA